MPATEGTARKLADLYQTEPVKIPATATAFETAASAAKAPDVRPNHVRDHLRDAHRQAHPGPSGERNSHIAALLASPRGLAALHRWARAWAGDCLPPAFTSPWLDALVIGGDKGEGKARPIAFEEMLLKLASSAALRAQLPQIRRAAGSYQYGVYHSGGAPAAAWTVHAHMAERPDLVYIACDIRNGFGAARRRIRS